MANKFQNWIEQYPDYLVNQKTKWVVRDNSVVDDKQWVILDDRGIMISCEWKDNKEDCMEEADRICVEELFV
ncbi:MAG TPA: hypothetical protein PK901_08710 [Bacteroidia bacterium]|nr:hypothetical protein [Bacteroidia bacterium]HRB85148.1 hypothetical protein [Bacteroidia bacterium]HRC35563.1 hypothetical protein [Bacteroidia bacterium]